VIKEVIIPNVRLLFWHLADEDYDGQHDAAAISTRSLRSGWIDGWVVMRDKDFDGSYDSCKAFKGQLRSELGLCSGDSTGYSVSGKEPSCNIAPIRRAKPV